MTVLTVLKVPDPRLRLKAQPVERVDEDVHQLMQNMLAMLGPEDAVGLAATQVGIQKRVLVLDFGREVHPHPLQMANPELLWKSDELVEFEEGCLSVPGQYAIVKRPKTIKVAYLDQNNKKQELSAEGLLADGIQHEIDHLNGILYVDHLSQLKRTLTLTKAEKFMKQRSRTPQ
jgi:peptide deformylase